MPSRPEYETYLISINENFIETTYNGEALATGTELLYSDNIWVDDTGASCHTANSDNGAVLTKDAGTRMKNLKPSLDASGNRMRTRKLIDVTGSILDSKTKKNTTITMRNCRFGGSKFNLCSLIKMTGSGWKMSGDRTDIYLSKGERTIHFNIPIMLLGSPRFRIALILFFNGFMLVGVIQ